MPSSRETHFTPKGVSIAAGPMAINIQPLRGCSTNFKFVDETGLEIVSQLNDKLKFVGHSLHACCHGFGF